MKPRSSIIRYFGITGTLNRWFYWFAFPVFLVWMIFLRLTAERADFSHYLFLFLVPLAAGTGLLTTARRGEFDLLLGSGQSRARVWIHAAVAASLIPALLAAIVFVVSGARDTSAAALVRLLGVLAFTAGIGFAVGLVETRYFIGAVWFLTRLIVMISPPLLKALLALEKGFQMPSRSVLFGIALLAPETLLEPRMPIYFALAGASIGTCAMLISYHWFLNADLGGKRS
jgi:hypothetical protein